MEPATRIVLIMTVISSNMNYAYTPVEVHVHESFVQHLLFTNPYSDLLQTNCITKHELKHNVRHKHGPLGMTRRPVNDNNIIPVQHKNLQHFC